MIDTNEVARPSDLVRRVPKESGDIQSVPSAEVVRTGIALQKFQHARISANVQWIVGEDVVGLNAIEVTRAATVANACSQRTIRVHQRGRVGVNFYAVDGERTRWVRYKVAVTTSEGLGRVDVWNFSESFVDG